jgi:hypothetical protein
MELLGRMVSTPAQLGWLVTTLIDRIGTYAGPDQIRAVFCTKFKPKDGIETTLNADSPMYQTEEQLIAEHQQRERERLGESEQHYRQLVAGSGRRLLPGKVEKQADELERLLVEAMASAKRVPEAPREKPLTRERREQIEAEIAASAQIKRDPAETQRMIEDVERRLRVRNAWNEEGRQA